MQIPPAAQRQSVGQLVGLVESKGDITPLFFYILRISENWPSFGILCEGAVGLKAGLELSTVFSTGIGL